MHSLRVGTRGSRLALAQANAVVEMLRDRFPGIGIKIEVLETTGDKNRSTRLDLLPAFGAGVFVRELDRALLENEVDFAVHSMKDIPVRNREGLKIAAIPERASPYDVLVSKYKGLEMLPEGAEVGTSSKRRRSELLRFRPDLKIVGLRGNIGTRLKKAKNMDAIVSAKAAFERYQYDEATGLNFTELTESQVMPSPGQGALGVVCRENDSDAIETLSRLTHEETSASVRAERAFLEELGGGCATPVGALGKTFQGKIILAGAITALDGSNSARDAISGGAEDPLGLGRSLARRLKAAAEEINILWR